MTFYDLHKLKAMGVAHVVDMMAMVSLSECKELNCTDISKAVGLCKATVTGLVNRLVKAEVVERYHRPGNRKEWWVRLTPHGECLSELITKENNNE